MALCGTGPFDADLHNINIVSQRSFNRRPSLRDTPEMADYLFDLGNIYREISYKCNDEWHINFAGLHRMVLAKLQEELIDTVGKIRTNGHQVTSEVLEILELKLSKYTAAVRDWEYMIEHAAKTDGDISKDLFVASSAKLLSYKLMEEKGVIEEDWKSQCQPHPAREGYTYLPGQQRQHVNAQKRHAIEQEQQKRSLQAKWKRFLVSIFGGVALIAPMLLMVLHRDQTTALATTSGSVLIFAIVVAIFTPAPPEAALGAVAAYAAVLVVFVGSALPLAG